MSLEEDESTCSSGRESQTQIDDHYWQLGIFFREKERMEGCKIGEKERKRKARKLVDVFTFCCKQSRRHSTRGQRGRCW